jgi:hypothetical protein
VGNLLSTGTLILQVHLLKEVGVNHDNVLDCFALMGTQRNIQNLFSIY